MPDEQPTQLPAESSPAPAASLDSNIERLKALTPDQRAHWRMTGNLPSDEPENEESATSDKPKAAASAATEKEAKTAPESDTGKSEPENKPKPKGGFQKRIDTLTGRNRTLASEVETKEQEIQRLREQLRQQTANKPDAEPKAAKSAATDDPEPKIDDYKVYDDFVRALTRWESRQTLREEREKATKEAADAERRREFDTHLLRLEEARGRYEDFDDVVRQNLAFANEEVSKAMQVRIVELENGPDVAYEICSNPDHIQKIAEIKRPGDVIAFLTRLSDRLAAAEAEPAKKETKPEQPKPLVRKKVTNAPPPPIQVGGRLATPEDEAEAAMRRQDFAAYKRIMNNRDIARSKGQ